MWYREKQQNVLLFCFSRSRILYFAQVCACISWNQKVYKCLFMLIQNSSMEMWILGKKSENHNFCVLIPLYGKNLQFHTMSKITFISSISILTPSKNMLSPDVMFLTWCGYIKACSYLTTIALWCWYCTFYRRSPQLHRLSS